MNSLRRLLILLFILNINASSQIFQSMSILMEPSNRLDTTKIFNGDGMLSLREAFSCKDTCKYSGKGQGIDNLDIIIRHCNLPCDIWLNAFKESKEANNGTNTNVTSIRSLDLSFNVLSREHFRAIAGALLQTRFSQLETLRIRGSPMKPEDLRIIVQALRKVSSLKCLSLTCTGLTDESAKYLRYFLKGHRGLQSLDLSENNFSPIAGEVILSEALHQESNLNEIDLSYNTLGPAGMKILSKYLKNGPGCLKSLKLKEVGGSNASITDLIQSILHRKITLTHLDLSGNYLVARELSGKRSKRSVLGSYGINDIKAKINEAWESVTSSHLDPSEISLSRASKKKRLTKASKKGKKKVSAVNKPKGSFEQSIVSLVRETTSLQWIGLAKMQLDDNFGSNILSALKKFPVHSPLNKRSELTMQLSLNPSLSSEAVEKIKSSLTNL